MEESCTGLSGREGLPLCLLLASPNKTLKNIWHKASSLFAIMSEPMKIPARARATAEDEGETALPLSTSQRSPRSLPPSAILTTQKTTSTPPTASSPGSVPDCLKGNGVVGIRREDKNRKCSAASSFKTEPKQNRKKTGRPQKEESGKNNNTEKTLVTRALLRGKKTNKQTNTTSC